MRLLVLALLAAGMGLASGCSNPDRDKSAVAARCMGYQSDYWRRATERAEAGKPPVAPDFTRYGCTGLYRHQVCGKLRPGADTLPSLAAACARAYCAELPAPKPGLCGETDPKSLDNHNLVRAMVQLDRAILFYETGVPDVAKVLSARHRIYLEKTSPAQ